MDWVDTYSSGMGAYGATPFKMSGYGSSAIETWYINTDGYLYGAGYNAFGQLGIGTNGSNQASFTKVGTSTSGGLTTGGFYKPIDFDVSQQAGIVVDSDGKVWTAGYGGSYALGLGSSYSSNYSYFRTVVTSGTSGATYLPTNYTAVAVAAGGYGYTNMILTSTGALYGAGASSSLGGAST
ncbi:MAG: hypothetical protein R3Y60_04385, partial [bacterium]